MAKGRYVWVRMGDNAEYEKFDSPYDAGIAVGASIMGKATTFRFHDLGVDIPPAYDGHNYVSLFWGDKDAQPIAEKMTVGIPRRYLRMSGSLNDPERMEFKRGVKESAYVQNPCGKKNPFGASIYLFHLKTQKAKDWVAENVPDATYWGTDAIAVEHRYVEDLAYGMRDDGGFTQADVYIEEAP